MGFWQNYKVLIVMGTSLGLIHLGWYALKSNPALYKHKQDYIPEPGIVSYVTSAKAKDNMKSQSWMRKNWLWVAGGTFVVVHLGTWLMQRTMKSVVRSEVALKDKTPQD